MKEFFFKTGIVFQDGLVNSTDAALRDLSGSSLKEFVHWSVKQSTKEVSSFN
jgi:hypothetical protein